MDVLSNQRHVSRRSFTFFVFATLAAVMSAQTDNDFSPSPWPYYLQVYPGTNPSGETSVGLKSLYFALMMSFGGDFRSSGAIPGVQVALDQINSDPTLLPGYRLHYTLTDSQCNRTVALDAFFKQIVQDPVKISWIGSGCSVATEPTAEISHYYNITQISCVSSSAELADRQRFRYYFQMLGTEDYLAIGFFGIIKQFEWRKVAFIEQNENLFTVAMEKVKTMLTENNITFTDTTFNTEDGIGEQPFAFDPQARIFIIATYAGYARQLICKAYRSNMMYPRYMFLTYGWYEDRWFAKEVPEDECTPAQRESVLLYTLAVRRDEFLTNFSIITDTGINGSEYQDAYTAHRKSSLLELDRNETNRYAQHCYDATWTLAFALNGTITELEENSTLNAEVWEAAGLQGNGTFPLDRFSYNNSALLEVIFRHVQATNFTGITGSVSFGSNGIREIKRLRIYQYRSQNESLEFVEIGSVNRSYQFTYLHGEEENLWPGGVIPYDGVPLEEVVSVHLSLTVIFSILTTAGIAFAVACLIFNFMFRNRKYVVVTDPSIRQPRLIRLSSYNLNYLIGCGAVIGYMSIYFFIIPTTNPQVVAALCTVSPWLTALGYSLCYGTILAKMTRVYFIFNNPDLKKLKYPLKDRHLALGVFVLVLIDVIILLVYTIVEGVQGNLAAIRVPNRENLMNVEGEREIVTLYFTYICSSIARSIFLGVLYGYKMVLQVIALVFAFATRKVKVKGLDDSKYIAAATYVTSLVLAVIIVATYSLREFVNVFPILYCTGFLIGNTVILGLVFVPKMVALYKDPQGSSIFDKHNDKSDAAVVSGNTHHNNILNISDDSLDKETMVDLRKRIKELECALSQSKSSTL